MKKFGLSLVLLALGTVAFAGCAGQEAEDTDVPPAVTPDAGVTPPPGVELPETTDEAE